MLPISFVVKNKEETISVTFVEAFLRKARKCVAANLLDEYFRVDGGLGKLGLHFCERLLLAHKGKKVRMELPGTVDDRSASH